MAKLKYPLEQVLVVKKNRVEKAKQVVEDKQRAFEVEEEKLQKIEEKRDTVLKHYSEKLAQLRKALDEGTTSDEILQMKAYLKVVRLKLTEEEKKVEQQKEQMQIATRVLEEAKQDLNQKQTEEEKIEMHKEEWLKQAHIEIAKQEAKEQDEIGQVLYELYRKKEKES